MTGVGSLPASVLVPVVAFECWWSPGGNVRSAHVGPEIETMLGCGPKDWTWALRERSLHADDRDRVRWAIEKAVATGTTQLTHEYRMVPSQGAEVWIREHLRMDRDGEEVRITGVMVDVTRVRQLAGDLVQAQTSFQTLVEQLPAVLYVDEPHNDYATLYVSPQLRDVLGIEPADWTAPDRDPWIEHLHPEDRERVLGQYEEYLAGGPDLDDYRMVRADGRIVWIRDRARRTLDAAGNPILEQGMMIDVTELKEAQERISEQVEVLERMDAVGRRLADLILRGTDLNIVLDILARTVLNPVVFEDPAHQLVGFATVASPVEALLAAWEFHSRDGHEGHGTAGVQTHRGTVPCSFVTITVRGQEWGRLHVLEVERELSDADRLTIDRVGAAIGLLLVSQGAGLDLATQAGSDLIADIAKGRFASGSEILRRAKGLGADLMDRDLVVVVISLEDLADHLARTGLSERDRPRVVSEAARYMRAQLTRRGVQALVAPEGGRIVVVLGCPEPPSEVSTLVETGARGLAEARPGARIAVGISRVSKAESLGRGLQEASEAAASAARQQATVSVRRFEDLGIQHLLTKLADGPDLARFVESQLSGLLAHDSTSASPLLPTLRSLIDHGGRKQPTAQALHIERRTLYHRIERIERLVGRDIEDGDARLHLALALHGLDILRSRRPE